jgi:hypothetical protein
MCRTRIEGRGMHRSRRRWKDIIRIRLREIGCGGVDWLNLVHDTDQWKAHVSTALNLRVPQNVKKFLTSCATAGFSRRTQLHRVSYVLRV